MSQYKDDPPIIKKKTTSIKTPSYSDKNKSRFKNKVHLEKKLSESKSKNRDKNRRSWIDRDEVDDLVEEIKDLPTKFQRTLVPDLEKISKTSKVYLNKYNIAFTKGFKPYVGNKYAPTIASTVSFGFILIILILVLLIFNHIRAYFPLQMLLIFIQIYLSIYFYTLCLSSLFTGLEPLRVFYTTSQSTFVCVQVLQTLAYVLYLVLLLMYLILVFSTVTGLVTKLLGLAQTFLGFGVGLHYYMTVFHRAVLHQPPKTSWMAFGLYATCFLLICLFGRTDGRKKIYLEEGGEEGKRS
ncbi:unnamed protein product [Fraxinus pennsylvanica]|uniref:Uncharacterized protein n=1 Tax=Fraxinus pennsylvanica TaxID=56036 RepID=A0AAD1ZAN3_9LAMI|nr:unnamed protein product [Fraxinus pennsylvanica]